MIFVTFPLVTWQERCFGELAQNVTYRHIHHHRRHHHHHQHYHRHHHHHHKHYHHVHHDEDTAVVGFGVVAGATKSCFKLNQCHPTSSDQR